MPDLRLNGDTSNMIRLVLPATGLAHDSAGLIISTIADNEASATVYAQASSNIETISTLGTFAAPTASKCRFKEVDATNHPGLYELQFANARFAVSSAKRVIISISGASGLPDEGVHYEVQLNAMVHANVTQWKGSTAPDNTGDAYARIGANGAGLTAITDKTGNLPASPAATSDIPTDYIKVGESYTYTNNNTSDAAEVTITETP